MHLKTVHRILMAATAQPHGILKIATLKSEREVRQMVEAGLITATLSDGKPGSFTAVNGVTKAGLRFLQIFRGHDFSQPIAPLGPRKL